MARTARSILNTLEACKEHYDAQSDARKAALLDQLEGASFENADDLLRFHEVLCFWRAYPDGPALLERVEALLDGFAERPDLKKLAPELVSSGIAGTRSDYAYYWSTAEWLAARWPESLTIRWDEPCPGHDRLSPSHHSSALRLEVLGQHSFGRGPRS